MSQFAQTMQSRIDQLTKSEMTALNVIDVNESTLRGMEYLSVEYNQLSAKIAEQRSMLGEIRRGISDIMDEIQHHELSLMPPAALPPVDNSLELAQLAAAEADKQRDHEREMAIIANETARENRLAAEAAAKVAATAQEQASQSMDSLLKGLQGDGDS